MVEVMERRREVEWSPDMELEGCDAEKAAALLLAVAPRCRSQSFEGAAIAANTEDTSTNATSSPATTAAAATGGPLEASSAASNAHSNNDHDNNNGHVNGEAGITTPPAYAPLSGSPGHMHLSSFTSNSSAILSGSGERAAGEENAISSSFSPRSRSRDVAREMEDDRSGDYDGCGGHVGGNDCRGAGGEDDDDNAMVTDSGEAKMEIEGFREHDGNATPPRCMSNEVAGGGTLTPRNTTDMASGERSGPSMLLSLAEFATKELLTMDEDPNPSANPNPNPNLNASCAAASLSQSNHLPSVASATGGSPRHELSPRGVALATSLSESAGAASAPARNHRHHLRERSTIRNRSGEDYDDEREDTAAAAFSRGSRGEDNGGGGRAGRRRNRPRSVSMPEGMELHATRAWGGSYSAGMRQGSRIEVIKEELDGNEVVPGTRSRAWRTGASGGRDRDLLFGSVEDAQALIGLGRPQARWNAGVVGEEGGEGDRGVGRGVGQEYEAGGSGEGEGEGEGDGAICVSLPHMLAKYADMYNKNGRIGIYTRQEREAIIARFKRKRGRRVWKKKIRYNCRKNLADKRLRVKGRFVKMSPEQRTALKLKKQKAMRAAAAAAAASGVRAADGAVSRTDSSTSAGSMDMDLLAGEEMNSETGSGGSGSGAIGEAFEEEDGGVAVGGDEEDLELEDEEGEELEEEDDEERGSAEVYPVEPPKRVRRHSIAY